MTGRAVSSKLKCALLLLATAWTSCAWALPEDRDARAPRWATADLACAVSDAPLPGCRERASAAVAVGAGSALLTGFLKRSTAPGMVDWNAPAAAAGKGPAPSAPAQAAPVIHALREVATAMRRDATADIPLAFVSRPAPGAPESERLEHARKVAAGFPFGVLFGWSDSLSGIYQGTGARFDHVLFHAVDHQRLISWNGVTPESTPDRSTPRAVAAGSLGNLDSAWLLTNPGPGPEKKPADAGVKKKRTIIYMERGRTTVMQVEEPPSK